MNGINDNKYIVGILVLALVIGICAILFFRGSNPEKATEIQDIISEDLPDTAIAEQPNTTSNSIQDYWLTDDSPFNEKWVWNAKHSRKIKLYLLHSVRQWTIQEFGDDVYSVWSMIEKSGFTAFQSANKQECVDWIDNITTK